MSLIKNTIIVILMCILVLTQQAYAEPASKISFSVLNEEGSAVEGALVRAGFAINYGKDFLNIDKKTDSKGQAVVLGRSAWNKVGFNVSKNGFYKTSGNVNFKNITSSRWEPWNPKVNVVLRNIEKPVPMYAKNLELELPVQGKEVGFDLLKADWVFPHGAGLVSDLVFKLNKRIDEKGNFDSKLIISFSNPDDGIILLVNENMFESELSLAKLAPNDGYSDKLLIQKKKSADGLFVSFSQKDNYIFRVRSKRAKDNTIEALYGKIVGPIQLGNITWVETANVSFKYCVNPDYTRNLEFDSAKNLFGSLPQGEKVDFK